ncbi:MAG TPA: four helix bundle suffix domain-containing protein [Planctomycetota bacterium]|nr:four helix bundle suffix domain-containing protein [Planctomycetota bacterium]
MSGDRGGPPERLIPPHGGYDQLKSYQVAAIVFEATMAFCKRFYHERSRTREQMEQAARSGKRNIAEGSTASGTSRKTELKLTGVARASLEELRGDYEDFLHDRGLPVWGKEHPQTQAVRELAYVPNRAYETYKGRVEEGTPEVAANTVLCLVHQANYLLDQQLRGLAERFVADGGFTERMYRVRRRAREDEGKGR